MTEKMTAIPKINPMSPTLLTMKALKLALIADSFLYQNPMSK